MVIHYWWCLLWREKTIAFLLSTLIFGVFMMGFFAFTIILETREALISFAAFFCRSLIILSAILLVPFYLSRLHQSGEIEAVLSGPTSRLHFLRETFLAFEGLLLGLTVFSILALGFVGVSLSSALQWGMAILGEATILLSFCFFLSCGKIHPMMGVISALAYYLMGRLHQLMTATLLSYKEGSDFFLYEPLQLILKVVPSFDLFSLTSWLLDPTIPVPLMILGREVVLFSTFFLLLTYHRYGKRWI
jgi:hypothetical protein